VSDDDKPKATSPSVSRGRQTAPDPLPFQSGETVKFAVGESVYNAGTPSTQEPVDEFQEKVEATIRKYIPEIVAFVTLEALAVPFFHAGADAMLNSHFERGIVGYLVGAISGVAGFTFHWWKGWFSRDALERKILPWWPAVLLLAFVYVAGPVMYRRATTHQLAPPFAAPTAVAAAIPTSIKLQFNSAGEATEIDTKNLRWKGVRPEETQIFTNPQVFAPCPVGSQAWPGIATIIQSVSSTCFRNAKTWMFILSFEKPITARKFSLNAYGATLPNWDVQVMTSTYAIIWVHGALENMVLSIEATD
jgi:hypothetical protein